MPESLFFSEENKEHALSSLPEEEIVLLAKSGSEPAMELIVSRYKNFVKARSKSYFLAGADREDVVQEGMIGLYKAIRSFKPDREASFKTFAELCITRHIISAVKSSTRQKHMPLNSYVSLNKESGEETFPHLAYPGETGGLDPEQILIEREDMMGIEGKIDKALSEFEAKVLMYHLSGMPYGKIAACLGKDAKSVDNALQRIRRKIEKFLMEKEFSQ